MKSSWRLYIVVIFVVLGGIFQFVGGLNSKSNPEAITGKDLLGLNLQPFSINNVDSKNKKGLESDIENFKKQRHRKLSMKDVTFPRNHSFDETKKKTAKKKKDDKKKKKKKVKEESTQLVESTVSYRPKKYAENETSDSDDLTPEEEVVAAGGALVPAENDLKDGDIPQTFEEWQKLLLNQPNKRNTAKFIEYYQSKLVPQTVFYQIVEAMFEDSRLPLRKLGVEAAGATPSLQSFDILTKVMEKEAHGSEIRGLITSHLANYQSLNHVNFLSQVLIASGSEFSLTIAAQHVKVSARRNLQPIETTGDTPPNEATEHPNANYFNRLLPALTNLSNSGSSSQLLEAAQDAIQTIEDLLG